MRAVRVRALAKVNLTLEVLGKRDDGYHEVSSVMALVDLADDVRVAPARRLDVRIRPDVGARPGDDLASRAVRALAGAAGREPHAHVLIRKRIPVAAGLGGGSSDAAAVMRALARMWALPGIDLVAIGTAIGSDVPFFASGATAAIARGRGERIEPLAVSAALWVVLVTLPARCSTGDVYAALESGDRGDGSRSDGLAAELRRANPDVARIRALAWNDLLRASERVCPLVAEARVLARGQGVELALSGSGPSLFYVADDRAHAIRVARALRRVGLRARSRSLFVGDPSPT